MKRNKKNIAEVNERIASVVYQREEINTYGMSQLEKMRAMLRLDIIAVDKELDVVNDVYDYSLKHDNTTAYGKQYRRGLDEEMELLGTLLYEMNSLLDEVNCLSRITKWFRRIQKTRNQEGVMKPLPDSFFIFESR